ncbi:MAG: hypothetical protein ACK5MW_00060 [Enterococcus sp.]
MMHIAKQVLPELTSAHVEGPFVTIMMNTQITRQGMEQDQLKVKNFAKEARMRFEKKYPTHNWAAVQENIDQLIADQNFWRGNSKSVAMIFTESMTYVQRLHMATDDQYYVGDRPYILAMIKNNQYHHNYYMLCLNRDSMKMFQVMGSQVSEMELPNAPWTMEMALGEELTKPSMNHSSGGMMHGVGSKDEEMRIDWMNYYQAIDEYLCESFENEEGYPMYLFALPENQTMFHKMAKCSWLKTDMAINASPTHHSLAMMKERAAAFSQRLTESMIMRYQTFANRKSMEDLVDMIPAARDGRIRQLFIATSNLIDGFGEEPDLEYDKRMILNNLADHVSKNGGDVYILPQKHVPNNQRLFATLRY